MNFNMHKSVDKTECFLDSLINCKSLKLVDDILNQFIHEYNSILLLIILEK